jgi:hypothetical protein
VKHQTSIHRPGTEDLPRTPYLLTADCDDIDPYCTPQTQVSLWLHPDRYGSEVRAGRCFTSLCFMVRNRASERCRTTLPKLRCS